MIEWTELQQGVFEGSIASMPLYMLSPYTNGNYKLLVRGNTIHIGNLNECKRIAEKYHSI